MWNLLGCTVHAGGARPLRAKDGRYLYGLPDLAAADKEKVKAGTLLATRCARLAELCGELDIPWLAETPLVRQSYPSVFKLTEWAEVLRAQGGQGDLDQCKFCLLYTSPSPRDGLLSRMPSSA